MMKRFFAITALLTMTACTGVDAYTKHANATPVKAPTANTATSSQDGGDASTDNQPTLHPATDYNIHMTCSSFLQTAIYDHREEGKLPPDEAQRRLAELANIVAPYIIPDVKGKPIDGAVDLVMKKTTLYCLQHPSNTLAMSLNDLKQFEQGLLQKADKLYDARAENAKGAHGPD